MKVKTSRNITQAKQSHNNSNRYVAEYDNKTCARRYAHYGMKDERRKLQTFQMYIGMAEDVEDQMD